MEDVWKRRTVRLKDSEYAQARRILRERETTFSQWFRLKVRELIASDKDRATKPERSGTTFCVKAET